MLVRRCAVVDRLPNFVAIGCSLASQPRSAWPDAHPRGKSMGARRYFSESVSGSGGGGAAAPGVDPAPRRLLAHLRGRIHDVGPLTVADYMREALTNPVGGYYMRGGA